MPTIAPPALISGRAAMASAFSEYADTCTAVATSSHGVSRKLPPRADCGANAIPCTTPSRPPVCSDTRSASDARWPASVTSSSRTGGGSGSRLAIRCTRLTRPNPVSTTVAPSCCASRATWKAIDASVSTPVTSIRLPSRIPIASLSPGSSALTRVSVTHAEAAVHRDNGPGDVPRICRGQERNGRGYLACGRDAAERHGGQDRRLPVLGQDRGHAGVHEPGRDHVDRDGPAAQLASQRPGQPDQARLGRRVVGLAARAEQADHRGDEDDPPPAHPDHAADGALGHPVGAGQVGVEHRGEVVLAHQREQLVAGDPGVGHQHLHRAVGRLCLRERLVHRRRVAHVTLHHRQPPTRLPGPLHLAGTGGDGDRVPFSGQASRDGQADAAVSAGHQNRSAHRWHLRRIGSRMRSWRAYRRLTSAAVGHPRIDWRAVTPSADQTATDLIDQEFTAYPLRELADAALQRAADLGADHADFRAERIRGQRIGLSDGNLETLFDADDLGLAVRVVVAGTWGFASAIDLTPDSAARAAAEAVEVALLADWSSGLLAHDGIDHVDASLLQVKECKFYSDGATTATQHRVLLDPRVTAVAVEASGRFETMRTLAPPAGRGYEFLAGHGDSWDFAAELAEIPELLAAKLAAPSVRAGRCDLVIDPSNLWLTIHESIGHATELDRALGYEAAFAGTSFATPDQLGRLQYGSPRMHVTGDRTVEHGLATIGYDDEGVAAQSWDLISGGVLTGYQLDRRTARLTGLGRSNGCAFADSPGHMPIQRMANVSLRPAEGGPSIAELIAGVQRGIYVVGDKSWSIDMQRYNFQFTGQRFFRISHGRLAGQLRDVAYQATTTDFWNAMEAVGGPQTYLLGGAFNCGKGQPSQVAPVSHGCPAVVARGIRILNTVEEAG